MAKETILVADDDQDLARLLSTHLRAHGFNVALSSDAVQTVMSVRRSAPAAIILDVNLPGGTGLDVLKTLKTSAKTNMIPVIVVSASTDPLLTAKVTDLGAEEFFQKPFDFEQLFRTLCQALGKAPESPAEELLRESWVRLRETRGARKERRKNLRIRTRGWVWVEYQGDHLPLGNLSRTGAFIRTEAPPALGTEVGLRLVSVRLPDPIEVTAVVRRSKPGQGMGVQFTRFHRTDPAQLEDVLLSLCATRILVVDSDENIRWALTLLFNEQHYSVISAADGQEALQKAQETQPDLILLDLDLPGSPGLEVCQRLRADSGLAHIPILVMSANPTAADLHRVQQFGDVGFVNKPFEAQKLLNQVRVLVSP